MASYIVKEEDGTSKLTLEEGGGSLLTEESVASVAADGTSNNGATYAAIGMYYD